MSAVGSPARPISVRATRQVVVSCSDRGTVGRKSANECEGHHKRYEMIGNVHDRLTGLDSSFLHLEKDGAHMHVASTMLFEGPPPPYTEFRDHIESRLHLVPRFRQRVH